MGGSVFVSGIAVTLSAAKMAGIRTQAVTRRATVPFHHSRRTRRQCPGRVVFFIVFSLSGFAAIIISGAFRKEVK